MPSPGSKIIDALFGSAAYIDIETMGLGADAPIHQVSVVNLTRKSATEYIPNPYILTKADPFDKEPLRADITGLKSASSWPEVVKASGSPWVAARIGSYPHLEDKATAVPKVATLGSLSANVAVKTGMSIGDVYKDVFRNIDDNQVIWIANAPFEAKKLGTIGALTGTTEDIRSQLSYAPRYSDDLLYVSEPSVMAARSRATATGDWTGVWNAIEGMDPNAPGKKVLDVLDVVRAAQSYGGLIAAKAGFNVDNHGDQVALSVQSRIMGLGPEIHKATQDNLLSAIVGKQAATHISAYKGMLERTHMATGTALRVETAQEADAMNWLWRMHKLKTSTSQHYMKYSTIARAMQDIEYGTGRHEFVTGFEEINVPQYKKGVGGTFAPIESTLAMPQRSPFGNMNEFLDFLSTTKRATGIDVFKLTQELRDEISSSGGKDRLKELVETGSSKAVEAEVESVENIVKYKLGDVVGNVFSSGQTKVAAASMGGRLGYALAGLGITAAAIGIASGIFKSVPSKDDAYNTIEGMPEDSYAGYLRETNTDFGSPYGGLSNSISLYMLNGGMSQTPTYVNNIPIDQQIANFRDQMMQTPLQKRIIQQEFQKQELKSLDRLYFLDPALTAPLASANYSITGSTVASSGELGTEALVKSKNLQVVDLSNVNWAVEDADTIIMTQGVKGLRGQEMQVRLAGIDAPEVEHSDEEMSSMRYKQGQPHGSESAYALKAMLSEAHDIKMVMDPTADTYGRALGVLIADGKNVNLELVRRGHAAALPFGEESSDIVDRDVVMSYEQMAYENNKGMWSDDYWRTYRSSVSQRNRITFNTLARIDKLAGNMNLAALESTMSLSRDIGYSKLVDQSLPYLRKKLSTIGVKREYSELMVPVKYQSNQQHLDQLKIETSRHMKTTGNLLGDTRMATKGHQFGNVEFAVDSLERSSSIYHSRLPAILDRYNNKAARRKVQGAVQRQANIDIMPNQNIVRM